MLYKLLFYCKKWTRTSLGRGQNLKKSADILNEWPLNATEAYFYENSNENLQFFKMSPIWCQTIGPMPRSKRDRLAASECFARVARALQLVHLQKTRLDRIAITLTEIANTLSVFIDSTVKARQRQHWQVAWYVLLKNCSPYMSCCSYFNVPSLDCFAYFSIGS